jgi:prepilin-type N-terminal cleavage/methylation domain-containing protein
MKGNKGFALIETIVALAVLGIVAAIFLGSVGTATRATMVAEEEVTAESLARSEIEYIKSCAYQDSATEYPIDPTLSIPNRWSMPNPTVEALDDGIQKVTITVQRDGENEFSAFIYKVDR